VNAALNTCLARALRFTIHVILSVAKDLTPSLRIVPTGDA
jgi:hypothetical protein